MRARKYKCVNTRSARKLSAARANLERAQALRWTHHRRVPEGLALSKPLYSYPEYNAFKQRKNRCTNPKHKQWADYGGRGIEFRFTSFEEFYAHIGPRPTPRHSCDRIENDGHYEFGNVRWATPTEQTNNRRPRKAAA